MDAIVNLPIQMIFASDTTGFITPIRFRFENNENVLQTIYIDEIISRKEINFAGIKGSSFICKAILDGIEKLFELSYTFLSHNWVLFRIL